MLVTWRVRGRGGVYSKYLYCVVSTDILPASCGYAMLVMWGDGGKGRWGGGGGGCKGLIML